MGHEDRNLLRSFFLKSDLYEEAVWRPSVDIYRWKEGWLVKCDLAGVRPGDVEVSTEGRRLRIAGARRDISCAEGQKAYSMEIRYNRFERMIDLPRDVTDCRIRCESREGMLLVFLCTS